MYALKFFTKSGLNRVLAMSTEKAAMQVVDEMRVNGCVIQIGRKAHRLEDIESIYIDEKQVFPAPITDEVHVVKLAFKGGLLKW